MIIKSELRKVMSEIDALILQLAELRIDRGALEVGFSIAELNAAKEWLDRIIESRENDL